MCVVSMMGDHYKDIFTQPGWPISPFPITTPGVPLPSQPSIFLTPTVTREEFDALKKTVEEMKVILVKAKLYDEANNEPNCEMEDKVALLKKIAELVGVDLSEVFGK